MCGPSGVGKGTLINRLQQEFPDKFGFSVSHTTRLPRKGEVDGVHYNFTNIPAMQAEIAAGRFLEHANVHGKIYGTSFAAVEKVASEGKICILDIDVQGAELVKKSHLDAVYVFISPPSMEELEKRLRGRGTEKEEAIQTRLTNAKGELAKRDIKGFFSKVIINDNLDNAYAELKAVIAVEIDGVPSPYSLSGLSKSVSQLVDNTSASTYGLMFAVLALVAVKLND